MTNGQLNHLSNLSELLAATANVVVTNIIELLFIFTLDRISVTVDDRVGGNDAVLTRIDFDNLKLHCTHASAADKGVPLLDWAVRFKEVGLEEGVEEITCEILDCVIEGQYMNSIAISDITARVHDNHVAKLDANVFASDFAEPHFCDVEIRVIKHDGNRCLVALPFDENVVSTIDSQLIHFVGMHMRDRVIFRDRILDNQLIWLQNLLGFSRRCSTHVKIPEPYI
mmetsp:Transcript_18227/g.20995  ORF Transcript_18227/g.20995 Transcript_18227/m.20995 type:complete len:226 (-) Transcript_18227:35-712(-)